MRIGGRSSDLLIGNQIHLADPKNIKHFQGPATTLKKMIYTAGDRREDAHGIPL